MILLNDLQHILVDMLISYFQPRLSFFDFFNFKGSIIFLLEITPIWNLSSAIFFYVMWYGSLVFAFDFGDSLVDVFKCIVICALYCLGTLDFLIIKFDFLVGLIRGMTSSAARSTQLVKDFPSWSVMLLLFISPSVPFFCTIAFVFNNALLCYYPRNNFVSFFCWTLVGGR